MPNDLLETLKDFLVGDLLLDVRRDDIGPDDELSAALGLDSIGLAELRVLCERRFHIRISDAEFASPHFSTVGSLAAMVERLKREAQSQSA